MNTPKVLADHADLEVKEIRRRRIYSRVKVNSGRGCYVRFCSMSGKDEVQALLSKLPDDCSLEDIQYHLYVIEKVRHALESADTQGTISQEKLNGVWRNGLLSRMVVEGR